MLDTLTKYMLVISEYLDLQDTCDIKLKKLVVWGKQKYPCHGRYDWDSEKRIHLITIERADIPTMMKTIRHELIHAWQCQLNIKLNHGKVFNWWMKQLEKDI